MPLMPHICATRASCWKAPQTAGKSIMFEAQLGALRDINYGIYPFTVVLLAAGGQRAGGLRTAAA